MATVARNRALVGSLISALASVAVALVGVLPRLREQDKETIAAQRTRLEELAQELSEFKKNFEVGPPESTPRVRWTITGKIRRSSSDSGRGRYEVYLVPGSRHLALSGDDGRFVFDDFFPGTYALIVRDLDSHSNRTARGLITPDEPSGTLSIETHGAWADYKVVPQAVQTASTAVRPREKAVSPLAVAALPAQNGGLQ